MGRLAQLLGGEATDKTAHDLFLDFEKAQPQSEEEKAIHAEVAKVLDKGPGILDKLFKYEGCEEFIRKAIINPSTDTEEGAWKAVLPAVDQLQEFYDFSLELDKCFPKLLVALCKQDPKESLEQQQALAKQLADVFDFVLRFDDAKMVNPAIQNDFSYYRRTLNRMKISKKDLDIKIRDDLANRMSLYFAYPTPMMNTLSQTTVSFLSQNQSVHNENVTTALSIMANVCQNMVAQQKFESDSINMFCLRAMTGAIILFDHVHLAGAFSKNSPLNMRQCINTLKSYTACPTDGLLNALRFTTIHLSDPDTPNSIKKLLN